MKVKKTLKKTFYPLNCSIKGTPTLKDFSLGQTPVQF